MLTCLFLSLLTNTCFSAHPPQTLDILIIESYDPSTPWSRAIFEGLTKVKQTSSYNIRFYFEYIDKLRLTADTNYHDLYKHIKSKYKSIKFSGVIADSDFASDFVIEYGNALVGNAPKVLYSNQQNSTIASNPTYLSLIGEAEQSVEKTAEIALAQNPEAKSILIIEGNNAVSKCRVRTLVEKLKDYNHLSVKVLSKFSIDELNKTVSNLDRNTIVFCTLIFCENSEQPSSPQNVIKQLAELSTAPIYSFWSTFINTGIVGGDTLDGEVAGSQLATAILDYLKDGRFKNSYNTLHTYFDWKAAHRFNIDLKNIPDGATIINRPISIWNEYHHELVAIAISLIILAIGAIFWLRRLSQLNAILRKSRDELEARVKERTHELVKKNQDLTDSEKRFRSLSDAAFEGIIFIEKGIIIDANNAIEQIFACSLSEIINSPTADFIAPEEREKVKNSISSHYSQPYESKGLKKDGTIFPVQIHGKNFSYQGREIRVTAIRDLTELKKSEEEIKILRGFIPICASCKKIRDDKGYWNQLESYISKHSTAQFSHSICPKCAKELYPELYKDSD